MKQELTLAMRRREFIRNLFFTAGAMAMPPAMRQAWAVEDGPGGTPQEHPGRFAGIGPLGDPDSNGVRTPPGFSTRVVAVAGELPQAAGMSVAGPQTGGIGNRPWHILNDGGGVVERPEGGWIYCSNSEVPNWGNLSIADQQGRPRGFDPRFRVLGNLLDSFVPGMGGVGTLVFDADGTIVDSYSILTGTTFNCAGAITPWKTWLSCEEFTAGQVWECDPFKPGEGVARPSLGFFDHEAVAVDTRLKCIYQSEDFPDSRFYRWLADPSDWPEGAERPALEVGRLQALVVEGDGVEGALQGPQPIRWKDVPNDPGVPQVDVRDPETSVFAAGEGVWLLQGICYFTTKGDDRVYAIDTINDTIEVVYDLATAEAPNDILDGVDNVTMTPQGDLLVAEDGGNMQVNVILPDRTLKPLLQVVDQDQSEIAGISFSPDGRRMYFTSDRGGRGGPPGTFGHGPGMLYELQIPDEFALPTPSFVPYVAPEPEEPEEPGPGNRGKGRGKGRPNPPRNTGRPQ